MMKFGETKLSIFKEQAEAMQIEDSAGDLFV